MPEQPLRVEEDHSIVLREVWSDWIERNIKSGKSGNPDNIRRGDSVLRLLKSLNLSYPNILDVGCANGWLCADLACFGKVTGIDLADKAITMARSLYPNVAFICGDFLALDLPTGRFDIVVSVDVIPYVDNQRAFLHKVAMVLKSRGYFIIICPNKFVWDRTRFTRQLEGKVPVRWLHMRDLKDLLSRHFVALHSETIIPDGNRGILRLINSNKVERAIETIIHPDHMVKLKERVGLGKSLVVLAQKRE
jgi:2-polyprenyl-3-methyl-5-hydroxy-6-metoxy-1,4-benzoquinol methylase